TSTKRLGTGRGERAAVSTLFQQVKHGCNVQFSRHLRSFVNYITDPDGFFEAHAEDPDWLVPSLVVLANGVLAAVGAWYTVQFATRGLDSAAVTTLPAIVGVVTGIAVPVVLWVVFAALFYGLSALFDGEGSFTTTLWLVGWGYGPALIAGLVSMLAVYYAGQAVPPAASFQEYPAVQRQIQTHQYVEWSRIVQLAVTLWQGVLWTYAVRHARNLDLREAAIVVALPVVASIGLTVNSLL
ncbi:MAG: Yip1 family protein, partial [Halobaculum sp.]